MRCSNGDRTELRAPLEGLVLDALRADDVEHVVAIERSAFGSPWRPEHFRYEILENRFAVNRAARLRGELVGYACTWELEDELKINNLAVREDRRGQGVARWMLRQILAGARGRGCTVARLEVRPSNEAARRLYGAFGFVEVGRRKGYYRVEDEDAIVLEATLS